MERTMATRRLGGRALWGVAALLSIGVALVSSRYLTSGAFPAPNVIANPFADPWLVGHVGGAATALLIGAFQFLPRVRARMPAVHRWLGRIYVLGCTIGSIAGLILALGSTAGPVATAGFGLLALLWGPATLYGWQLARRRRFAEHRRWMIRSWSLTFAAVTLRLYLPLAPALGLDFFTAYRAIAWACWVPNLLVAELWLRTGPLQVSAALPK